MEEIGDYTGNAEKKIFDGMAGLYERLAADSSAEEIEALRRFFEKKIPS